MSSDVDRLCATASGVSLNPFGTGQCLPTHSSALLLNLSPVSIPLEQGSVFRLANVGGLGRLGEVSIPLEQGSVFRRLAEIASNLDEGVSIPLEQGSVFRLCITLNGYPRSRLNPFGTGQCLPTAVVF